MLLEIERLVGRAIELERRAVVRIRAERDLDRLALIELVLEPQLRHAIVVGDLPFDRQAGLRRDRRADRAKVHAHPRRLVRSGVQDQADRLLGADAVDVDEREKQRLVVVEMVDLVREMAAIASPSAGSSAPAESFRRRAN